MQSAALHEFKYKSGFNGCRTEVPQRFSDPRLPFLELGKLVITIIELLLIESGTSGYTGQVQTITKDQTECYDCTAKPVPKTFAVTLHDPQYAPPRPVIACIAWAKSYLFP